MNWDLRLLSGRSLEAPNSHCGSFLPLWPEPVGQQRIAAVITSFTQLPEQHLGVPDTGLQTFFQVWPERLQFTHRAARGP